MKVTFTARQLSTACLPIVGIILTGLTAHAQDAIKTASPTNITVRSETATPIRVILPSLWDEKSPGRKSDAAVNAPLQR